MDGLQARARKTPAKIWMAYSTGGFRIFSFLIPALCCSWIALFKTQEAINIHHLQNITAIDEDLIFSLSSRETTASNDIHNLSAKQSRKTHDCDRQNSKEWLLGPRLGNSNVSQKIDFYLAKRMIMGTNDILSTILSRPVDRSNDLFDSRDWNPLQHTICYNTSTFVNVYENGESNRERVIRLWLTRMVYLSIHVHQHKPAVSEFIERNKKRNFKKSYCEQYLNDHYQLGSFDYECPSSRFLVVQLFENGIGANVRLAAVPALMVGLAMNRIVLFVSNSPSGPQFIRNPWTLSSCSRQDSQCFFLPMSPCVITWQEIAQAYQLKRNETRAIFRHGTIFNGHENERVLIMHLTFRPQRFPLTLRHVLHNISTQILDDYYVRRLQRNQSTIKSRTQVMVTLRAAVDQLLSDAFINETATFNYYGANSPIFHGLMMYFLRPNPQAMTSIDNILETIIPSDFDSERSLGLPIRGSDKCGTESECMSFNEHIDAANVIWQMHNRKDNEMFNLSSSPVTVFVTTESRQIRNEYGSFVKDEPLTSRFAPYRYKFYTNLFDVTQDSGYLDSLHLRDKEYSADDAMLSAMSSLKFQLATSVTVGNCCSNFHLLLKDLSEEGCGSAIQNHFQCLQNHPDPQYRLCCSWDKSDECRQRRMKHDEYRNMSILG